MLIRPELEALRSYDAPQRRAQGLLGQALDRWRATPLVAAADAELAQWGQGAALDDLPVLSALFAGDDSQAAEFCAGLVGLILAELEREPLGQSPLRHYMDGSLAAVTVLRRGTTVLTLQAIDGHKLARAAAPVSVRFVPAETIDVILAGHARADRIELAGCKPGGADLVRTACALAPGAVSHREGWRQSLHYTQIDGSLVMLRLQRRTGDDGTAREFSLEDGSLLHQAAASPRDSRLELTAALLGRMGRADAAPLLAAMAEEQGQPSLRWQMLRECLALDTARGFETLCRLAAEPSDPLAAPAGALRAQLIEAYPQLAGIEPCPAC